MRTFEPGMTYLPVKQSSKLIRQGNHDKPTCAIVSAVLIATALFSVAMPTIRAARIEPNAALREE